MLIIVVILGLLGLCLGSFVNALVWRLQNGKDWVGGRSQCVACGHRLAPRDLVPVVSWLALRGRCRYCQKSISVQYPVVESTMAAVFVISYLWWPEDPGVNGQWLLLGTWLVASVGLMALAVYDWQTKLLPSGLVYVTAAAAIAGRIAYILVYATDKPVQIRDWAAAVAVAAGIFVLIYIVSSGRLIGAGDVRLGLATGTLLATPADAILMIFFASVLGTMFALPGLIRRTKNFRTELPYGPFLITATMIAILFGPAITSWYQSLITP